MAANELQALARDRIGGLGRLLPARDHRLGVRIVEPVHALSLRHLPGGEDAVVQAASATGITSLPTPGRFEGADQLVLWRNPTEHLLVTRERDVADAVLRALAPGAHALAVAVDQSDGLVTLELHGARLDDVLHRLVDASAVPRAPGQGTRARLADIAVFVLRLAPDRAWLMADRANDQFLVHWVAHAAAALNDLP